MSEETQSKKFVKKRRDILGPLVLVVIGLIFLLQNFGYLPQEIWRYLWRFWPVLLILGGIQLIFAQHKLSNIIIGGATIGTFGVLVTYSLIATGEIDNPVAISLGENREVRTQRQSINNSDLETKEYEVLDINYRIDAGQVTLKNSDRLSLVSNTVKTGTSIEPKLTFEESNQKVSIQNLFENQVLFGSSVEDVFESEIGGVSVPTNIDLDLGKGTANVTLEALFLDQAQFSVGTGTFSLDLSKMASASATIDVNVGLGSAQVYLPPEMTYELEYDVGVGRVTVDGVDAVSGLGSSGRTQRTQGDAETDLKISVTVGTGNIEIITE